MLYLRRGLYALALTAISIGAAEVASRADDWWREQVPLLSSPDPETSLRISDESGTSGRPYGRYKKWVLNEWGFRGPSMEMRPSPSTRRVMVLGASEAFGLYESLGKEFPAQLEALLRREGEFEVANASVVGMTLASIDWHWRHVCSQFNPDVVVIYASPLFYLGERPPAIRTTDAPPLRFAPPSPAPVELKSRYLERLRDIIEIPQFIVDRRIERLVASRIEGKPADWLFRTPPLDRLNLFADHLLDLGRLIRRSGARVILCTHATRVVAPFSALNLAEFERGRVHLPRATARAAAEFHDLANDKIRTIAVQENWALVDAARRLGGDATLFGDLVHFTDNGAKEMAALLSSQVLSDLQIAQH